MKKNEVSDLTKKMSKSGGKNTLKKPSVKKEEYTPIPLVEYKDLMDTKEVCELFHISIDTLYKWIERKQIPHYKISNKKTLFNRNRLMQWLESCEVFEG